MMQRMGVRTVLMAPFTAVAAPFRMVSRCRSTRRSHKRAKAVALSELRFSRMTDRDQREVNRTRSRFSD